MKKFKLYKPLKDQNIILVMFDTQYDLCSTLVRIQEYYESDSDQFRGKLFSLDDYMDYYASKHDNKFTYFEDWNGFNIPSHIIQEWINVVEDAEQELRNKEFVFLESLIEMTFDMDKFYMIACHKSDTSKTLVDVFEHEVSHALYYLVDYYKYMSNNILNLKSQETRYTVTNFLVEKGYGANVIDDETCAYLSTLSKSDLKKMKIKKEYYQPFKDNFSKFYNRSMLSEDVANILYPIKVN